MRKRDYKVHPIPVVDIFAGPGGLSEGFSHLKDNNRNQIFDVVLSIENDAWAHQTLELRTFFRQFSDGQAPPEYYEYLKGTISRKNLFSKYPSEAKIAKRRAWMRTLGKGYFSAVKSRIIKALNGASTWVLIGGPPCQAYSLVGRSRLRPVMGDAFEKDERHFLYQNYLQILAECQPSMFVFENVKGILSSTMEGLGIFERIVSDLSSPCEAQKERHQKTSNSNRCEYLVVPLASEAESNQQPLQDFIVKSEDFGIPQKRHRVILIGIRKDLLNPAFNTTNMKIHKHVPIPIERVIGDLPKLTAGASPRKATKQVQTNEEPLLKSYVENFPTQIASLAKAFLITGLERGSMSGSRFTEGQFPSAYRRAWFSDPKLNGICNHESRSHMTSDLARYLFSSTFALTTGKTPQLTDFPKSLLPAHKNLAKNLSDTVFIDRFRVQTMGRPATTITSHIAKDGHYFIHYDPTQCRSLSVREAARIQTFPDNYFFEGPRTAQYIQVGNAVPPLLASQIGKTVHTVLNSLLTRD